MKVTLFTSNQPRHLYLAKILSKKYEVFCIIEGSSIQSSKMKSNNSFTGLRHDYFKKVKEAEEKIFGNIGFLKSNINSIHLNMGDINFIKQNEISDAIDSKLFIVFGSSYIKGWLCDFLIRKKAINLHMGISPYYRGSACNFWALYDYRPNYVGATIHLLDENIDAGNILCTCKPKYEGEDPFIFAMKAVKVGQNKLLEIIKDNSIFAKKPILQKKNLELRYSLKKDFSDTIIKEYLDRDLSSKNLHRIIENSANPKLYK